MSDEIKTKTQPLPKFENISDGFQVAVYSLDIENIPRNGIMEKTTEKILKLIENNPHISRNEIAEIIGITSGGYWRIIEKQ